MANIVSQTSCEKDDFNAALQTWRDFHDNEGIFFWIL